MKMNRWTRANWPLSSSRDAAYAMSGAPNASPASSPTKIMMKRDGDGAAPKTRMSAKNSDE